VTVLEATRRTICLLLALLAVSAVHPAAHGQAALLLEDAYGRSRFFDPNGHVSIYFARVCGASITRLRRCRPGELGSVIGRYGALMGHYNGLAPRDWYVIPLMAYLYAVDDPADVPTHLDQDEGDQMRKAWHDEHLKSLPANLGPGGLVYRGWNQMMGQSFNRKIYVFRFNTTEAQDDALIAWLNNAPNRTQFSLVSKNCANFAAGILNFYFPHVFHRHILPDGGIVTPRQIAYELVRYAEKHPELALTKFEIPQVPGYRQSSKQTKSVVKSVIVAGYIVPIAIFTPYAAGAIGVDFAVWGRYPLGLKNPDVLGPENMEPLMGATERQAAAGP
jgi:hypothetical protein